RDAEEHPVDALAQLGLADRGLHRGALGGVEGVRDLPDLVVGLVGLQAGQLAVHLHRLVAAQPVHDAGQLRLGELAAVVAQPVQIRAGVIRGVAAAACWSPAYSASFAPRSVSSEKTGSKTASHPSFSTGIGNRSTVSPVTGSVSVTGCRATICSTYSSSRL